MHERLWAANERIVWLSVLFLVTAYMLPLLPMHSEYSQLYYKSQNTCRSICLESRILIESNKAVSFSVLFKYSLVAIGFDICIATIAVSCHYATLISTVYNKWVECSLMHLLLYCITALCFASEVINRVSVDSILQRSLLASSHLGKMLKSYIAYGQSKMRSSHNNSLSCFVNM